MTFKEIIRSIFLDLVFLGRLIELEELFKPHLNSIDDILRYERNTARQRIKRT